MKRILLINSPLFAEAHELNTEDYLPPLGLGVVATALMKHGIQVDYIDAIAEGKTISELIAAIAARQPDFVGINIFTTNFRHVKEIVERTETRTSFIIGGISTRSLYREIFKWRTRNSIDIIYGDGEFIVGDIVNSAVGEEPVEQRGGMRYFVVSKESHYYAKDISQETIDRTLFKNEPYINCYGRPEVSIYTSRGCIYNCAYCVAAHKSNSPLGVRVKNTSSVIAELKRIRVLYPSVEYIRILDDLFLRNRESFADANTIFENFSYSWRAMCHIRPLHSVDASTLANLRSNGCKELFVGIESGSKRILAKIHKETDQDVILAATDKVFQAGINLKGYFICGFPGENRDDMEDTFRLAGKIKSQADRHHAKFRTSTFQFRPYYGTELYEEILAENRADPSLILFEMKESKRLLEGESRTSFNFDCGNYSTVDDTALQDYIRRMNGLNGNL